VRSRLDPGSPRWLLYPALGLCAWMLAQQMVTLRAPPLGEHRHREADTYALAYNFRHESADFFHPRIDWNHGRSGIMGMEAPILPWVTSWVMYVFGDDPATARTVFWLCAMAGLVCGVLLLRRAEAAHLAAGFLLMFALSPMALFELRQIQSDGPAAMLALAAAFFFWRSSKRSAPADFAVGMAIFSAAALAKGPALALAPAMWLFSVCGARTTLRAAVRRGLLFLIPLALSLLWLRWARHLNVAYNAGVTYFDIDFTWREIRENLANKALLRHLFEYLLPCYVTHWCLAPAVVVGFAVSFRREHVRLTVPFLAWFACAAAFAAAFADKVERHWYYADVLLPPVCYFGALGLAEVFALFSAGRESTRPHARAWAAFTLLLALSATTLVGGRASFGHWVVGAASEYAKARIWPGETGLRLFALAAVLGVALAAVRPRCVRWVALPFLCAALALMVPRAVHDATEALEWRTRRAEWDQFEQRIARARSAMDRYSTRRDLIVADDENPWWLWVARRKGWADGTEAIENNGLDHYRKRGGRLLFHVVGGDPVPALRRARPLEVLGDWSIYCIDRGGCRPL
jgi:hypothetical protein